MASVVAQWRVLESAFDELNLWELPGRHTYIHSGGTAVTPNLSVGEVREALAEAIRSGLVRLYDQEDPTQRDIDLEESLALVANEGEWSAQTAQRRAALVITPAGEVASHDVFKRYRQASPFEAMGAVDPQVVTDPPELP